MGHMVAAVRVEFDHVKVHLQRFLDTAESWKPEHDLAMSLYGFQDLLNEGMKELHALLTAQDEWQQSVLSNRATPDLDGDQLLWEWSDEWLRTGRRLRRRIATFENQGFDVEHAKPFREAVRNLEEDMKGLSFPTVALRPFTAEEADCMASMCGEPAKSDAV